MKVRKKEKWKEYKERINCILEKKIWIMRNLESEVRDENNKMNFYIQKIGEKILVVEKFGELI